MSTHLAEFNEAAQHPQDAVSAATAATRPAGSEPPYGVRPATPPPPPPRAGVPPAQEGTRDVLMRIAAGWKTILIAALFAAVVAWIFAALQPERFRASAIAAVVPIAVGLEPADVLRGVDTLERRTIVATVAALASTPATRGQALGSEPAEDWSIQAAVLPNTNLLRIDVEGTDAANAAAIANRVAQVIDPQTREMYRYYGVATVSRAAVPQSSVSPRTSRTVAAGLLLGAIVGVAIASGLGRLRRRV